MSFIDFSPERIGELRRMINNEIPMRTIEDKQDIEKLQRENEEQYMLNEIRKKS